MSKPPKIVCAITGEAITGRKPRFAVARVNVSRGGVLCLTGARNPVFSGGTSGEVLRIDSGIRKLREEIAHATAAARGTEGTLTVFVYDDTHGTRKGSDHAHMWWPARLESAE